MGRFTLGLGTSVQSWSEGMFGGTVRQAAGAPARGRGDRDAWLTHDAHTGKLERYDGKYYHLDFSELRPSGPPLPHRGIPIWIAALRGPLVSLGAEIAGRGARPLHLVGRAGCGTKARRTSSAGSTAGASSAPTSSSTPGWRFAINNDRAEAIDDARPTVAFYAGIPAGIRGRSSRPTASGEEAKSAAGGREARRLPWASRILVPDEMAETFSLSAGRPTRSLLLRECRSGSGCWSWSLVSVVVRSLLWRSCRKHKKGRRGVPRRPGCSFL